MRAILVDWMTQVCSDHLFKRETLYYAVNFLDRYLSIKKHIAKEEFQLIGVTSVYLAAKMDEIYTPKLEYMQAATKNAYSADDILKMEIKMYKKLDYKITPPTINMWANWYINQWDKFIEEEKKVSFNKIFKDMIPKFKNPNEQSYTLFRKLFSYLDGVLLDIYTLQYK